MSMQVLGLVPARGGSKSIPHKNIVPLAGRPLISYVIEAGRKSERIQRIICSTDDSEIADVAKGCGCEVLHRPAYLAQDDTHIIDVIIDVLELLEKQDQYKPDIVALLQPTSPFVLPEHIDESLKRLADGEDIQSVQTVSRFPHNFHAFNQRQLADGLVTFRFAEERAKCYNKQTKPKFYIFGNFLATRREALFQRQIFADPSAACEIPYAYALDVDGPDDLELAEWYLSTGKIHL